MAGTATPVVFIHGLWVHSSSWQPWMDHFREAGYEPFAPGWPGDAETIPDAREGKGDPGGKGIDAVVAGYVDFIKTLPSKPVLVGHSFGGLVAQKLLGMNEGCAGVAIDPAPIKGVRNLPVSALRVASVALRNPLHYRTPVSLTKSQFRYGFGNAITEEESDVLWENTIPSSGRPFFEASSASFVPGSPAAVNTKNSARGPLLLIAGGKDHAVPKSVVKATQKQYAKSSAITDYHEFPDRGHSLTLDSNWSEIADYAMFWLGEKGVGPTR